uniref:diguanylate cyclase n=1 Tax=Magnetococcus massalia (strain MO-1) TaxID=451514 RepID=A0A1S7LKE9_MAGMO|nr:Putative response regulator receiver GGDEF [Candidatus Magnetococcus massalia]
MFCSDEMLRVLVVDDDRLNITILNDILADDYKVKVAINGAQALDRAMTDPKPDLILLDIVMPGLDGFEVCKKLQINPNTADIPIIFITAKNSEMDEVRGLEMGGTDFISKPIRPEIVKARVRNHMIQLKQKRELQEMHRKVLALSITDSLTKIPNRRRFDEFLHQEWVRSQRTKTPLGLLMMDIDYFKNYNDFYGHAGGDLCLQKIAATLEHQVRRPPDLMARYGGEEFVCVLPDTHLDGVRKVGESILSAVHKLALPHARSAVGEHVSLSIGGTSIVPSQDQCVQNLIQSADGFLYDAKSAGRNRMTVKAMAS